MGRLKYKKVKSFDPFSKSHGVVASDSSKFNDPPKKKRRERDDDSPVRTGSLLVMAKHGGPKAFKKPFGLDTGERSRKESEAPMKRAKGGAGGEEEAGVAAAVGDGVPRRATAAAVPEPKQQRAQLLTMLPGETFQQFAQRVNEDTHAKLNSNNAAKVKGLSLVRKAKMKGVKENRKAKNADTRAATAAKAVIVASGNTAAIKAMKEDGVDPDAVEEVLKRTDVVAFGERVEAPPMMSDKMKAYFDKLKSKSEAASKARDASGPAGKRPLPGKH